MIETPVGESDEQRLVEAARKDPRRFGPLYEEHFDRVYAYVVRRLRDRAEAEDATSDVFHRALAHLPRYEWRGVPFAAWLYKIAANVVADRVHRAAKEHRSPMPERDLTGDENPADEIERRALLFRLVQTLPRDQRRVVALRFAEGKTIREIAAELGRTEGAVKQLQFRALQNLKSRMGGAPTND